MSPWPQSCLRVTLVELESRHSTLLTSIYKLVEKADFDREARQGIHKAHWQHCRRAEAQRYKVRPDGHVDGLGDDYPKKHEKWHQSECNPLPITFVT